LRTLETSGGSERSRIILMEEEADCGTDLIIVKFQDLSRPKEAKTNVFEGNFQGIVSGSGS
jgi:hypothetical protein